MNILYFAYSCDPYNGSEDQIGWNIPFECEKLGHKVFVLTAEDQREYIEKFCKDNNYYKIKFFYVDIAKIYKKIFTHHLLTLRIKIFNRKAFKIAKKICNENEIELIHQITPVEFRRIGKFGKIDNVRFIVGPVGGGAEIPKALLSYAGNGIFIELIRKIANRIGVLQFLFNGNLKHVDKILYVSDETRNLLKTQIEGDVITEIGIKDEEILKQINYKQNDITNFLVVGRLAYVKGHNFLLDALKDIPDDLNYNLRIVGDGKRYKELKKRIEKNEKISKRVTLCGKVDYNTVINEYDKCDVVIMPSLREATGTVILEALSRGKPVITLNKFGAKSILNNENAWLYDGNNKQEMISTLKNTIIQSITDKEKLKNKSLAAWNSAKKYTWNEKIKIYEKIYKQLI